VVTSSCSTLHGHLPHRDGLPPPRAPASPFLFVSLHSSSCCYASRRLASPLHGKAGLASRGTYYGQDWEVANSLRWTDRRAAGASEEAGSGKEEAGSGK
jgi:hypothetical protein